MLWEIHYYYFQPDASCQEVPWSWETLPGGIKKVFRSGSSPTNDNKQHSPGLHCCRTSESCFSVFAVSYTRFMCCLYLYKVMGKSDSKGGGKTNRRKVSWSFGVISAIDFTRIFHWEDSELISFCSQLESWHHYLGHKLKNHRGCEFISTRLIVTTLYKAMLGLP